MTQRWNRLQAGQIDTMMGQSGSRTNRHRDGTDWKQDKHTQTWDRLQTGQTVTMMGQTGRRTNRHNDGTDRKQDMPVKIQTYRNIYGSESKQDKQTH